MNTAIGSVSALLSQNKINRSEDAEDIPQGVLLLGDSMVRNIRPEYIPDAMVIKFAYPGITGKQLQNQFKSEFLPAPEHIGIIILHVGTNNASTFKQNQPVWDAVNEVLDCISLVNTMYPTATLLYSANLPRWDENHDRAQDMNEKIRKTLVDQAGYWPNVEFADFTPEMGNVNFYRWPETQYTDAPDPVHLSEMGVQRFQEILKTNISRLKQMRESPEFKFDEKQLKTEQHWMYWRKETYGLRTPKRFKITNYGPAIEVMLENDPNANLNREVPVTPTKPKPATHCQKFIARVLPELQISCFEIKSKDWQAIGELQGLCFEQRARTENAAREKLARKILTIIVRNQNKKIEESAGQSEDALPQKTEPISEPNAMDESESGATVKPDPEPVPEPVPETSPDETKVEILSEIKSESTKMEVDANG